ncbi:MAG TPA: hypothetical protein VKV38_05645, partial [Trebonia sp.]|nr:hypothetical protein [Trebonia sp.]
IAGVELAGRGKGGSTTASDAPGATPSAAGAATAGPTAGSAPRASQNAGAAGQPAATTGYRLTTPATAGGYPLLTPVPGAVRSAAGTTAQAVRGSIVTGGGKITSQVSAVYRLSGGQAMSFTGYEGTFTPATVIAGLGADARTYAAGDDGGKLACFTASGAQPGTVCVWATTTTAGITEFFGPDGPETVTVQSKAAADTVKVRGSVERAR